MKQIIKEVDPDSRGVINFPGAAYGPGPAAHTHTGALRSAPSIMRADRTRRCKPFSCAVRSTLRWQTAEFVSIMGRDIREFDNEKDLRAAWKVFDKARGGSNSRGCRAFVLACAACLLWEAVLADLCSVAVACRNLGRRFCAAPAPWLPLL